MAILFGIIGVFLFFLIAAIPWHFIEKRKRLRDFDNAFEGRSSLPTDVFYSRYYASTEIPEHVIARLRTILEEELGADLSRLQPDDKFEEIFGFFDGDDWFNLVEAVMRIEEEFNIRFTDKEAGSIPDFEFLANLLWNKLSFGED